MPPRSSSRSRTKAEDEKPDKADKPAEPQQDEDEKPEPKRETPPHHRPQHQGVSNASPQLPANAQASAARAHAIFSHVEQLCQAAQRDIEKYVPAELLAAAKVEIAALIQSLL